MSKKVLLYALIATILSSLNVGNLESQNVFTPISKSTYEGSKKFINKYYDDDADVNVLIPCFSLIKGYPTIVYLRRGSIIVNVDNKTHKMECSYELYESLKVLAKHAVMTASYTSYREFPDAQLDFLFYGDNGATCISSTGTCSETMDFFRHLADAVKAQDKTLLEGQKAVSDSLCRVFKTYYPKEAVAVERCISWAPDKSYSKLEISASIPEGPQIILFLTFEYEAMRDYDRDAKPYVDKYGSTLQEVAYQLLVNPDIKDCQQRTDLIVDESVSEPTVTKSGFRWSEITLRSSDITPEKLLSLIK